MVHFISPYRVGERGVGALGRWGIGAKKRICLITEKVVMTEKILYKMAEKVFDRNADFWYDEVLQVLLF